ncbi:hypothetical protein T8K17_11200 [Thalassobaculum sp. OXR-137]|uniref:hypothetical protein n=1 Tax=Thalassobaculum sp. OXR-137 TaxID=3100173 RepID=UPI002AC98435|nr:hypothetical protein [Thalassobaculum sp. OXR-137]WPZ36701.1 hypothetical protein T8K17_11200 [Thalassobaculum sp. OXR-137]
MQNAYYARINSNISSPGLSVGGGGGRGGGQPWGQIANLFSNVIGAATYDEDKDPRAQAARKYGLEADNLAAEATGRGAIADLFGGLDLSNPDSVAQAVKGITTEVARSGGNPDSVSDLMRFLTANTPGTSEDQVGRAAVGAGGSARTADTAYTLAGQTAIRGDNERVADEQLDTKETGLGNRNRDTIAGSMREAVLQEGGRNTRADADRASKETLEREKPVVASGGSTVLTVPGDQRTTQTTVPGGSADKPINVSPQDSKVMEEMVLRSLPEGAEVEDGVINSVVNRASELYQETRNAGTAVQQAIKERAEVGSTGGWWTLGATPTVTGKKDASPAAPAEAGTQARPTATNPQTGEKIEWDGTKWVPVT